MYMYMPFSFYFCKQCMMCENNNFRKRCFLVVKENFRDEFLSFLYKTCLFTPINVTDHYLESRTHMLYANPETGTCIKAR